MARLTGVHWGASSEPPPIEKTFLAEPIVAYRLWTVFSDRADGRTAPVLRSCGGHSTEAWFPRKRKEACCHFNDDVFALSKGRDHAVPHPTCSCGLYSVTFGGLMDVVHTYSGIGAHLFAIGSVSIWGKVLESGTEKRGGMFVDPITLQTAPGPVIRQVLGYRSQYAYPKHLMLLGDFRDTAKKAPHLAKRLGEKYGIQVQTPKDFTGWGEKDEGALLKRLAAFTSPTYYPGSTVSMTASFPPGATFRLWSNSNVIYTTGTSSTAE